MPFDDPATWAQGVGALKTAIDTLRSVASMFKDLRAGGSKKEEEAIDAALTLAASNTAIAEAKLAQAFGYELCKCEFPPVPMRTVGYHTRQMNQWNPGDPVYECPKCGYISAGPYGYARTAPPREPSGSGG